jgi:hypothetical protein
MESVRPSRQSSLHLWKRQRYQLMDCLLLCILQLRIVVCVILSPRRELEQLPASYKSAEDTCLLQERRSVGTIDASRSRRRGTVSTCRGKDSFQPESAHDIKHPRERRRLLVYCMHSSSRHLHRENNNAYRICIVRRVVNRFRIRFIGSDLRNLL